jgi:hypothetical protein
MLDSRRKAIVLLLVGIVVPLLFIPFLSGYKADAGWFSNLMNIKVALGPVVAIPYRFVLAVAIFLIFLGVRQLDLLRH